MKRGAKLYSLYSLGAKDKWCSGVSLPSKHALDDTKDTNNMSLKPRVQSLVTESLLYILQSNTKSHSLFVSDYELVKSQRVFSKMLSSSPSCHEALFGLAKNHLALREY